MLQVAIDGPAGAGKSTVARLVAKRLKAKYVDSGAMYRAIAWLAIVQGIDVQNEEQVFHIAESADFVIMDTGIIVNGKHLIGEIRTVAVAAAASAIAQYGSVREVLVQKQRQIAGFESVVMDGRDIGTHVLPNAKVKVFLTASIEARVLRRLKELRRKGERPPFESLRREIIERDFNDKNRKYAPLRRASDASQIDTTHLTTDQVVEQIVGLCRTKLGGEE